MRACPFFAYMFFAVVGNLLASPVCRADDPDDLEPIPQDAAKLKTLRDEKRSFFNRAFTESYRLVGKKSPEWDDLVVKSFEKYFESFFAELPRKNVLLLEAVAEAKKAQAKGCNDELIVFFSSAINPGAAGLAVNRAGVSQAVDKLIACEVYPPVVRCMAISKYMALHIRSAAAERSKTVDVVAALFAELFATGHFMDRAFAKQALDEALEIVHKTGGDVDEFHEAIQSAMNKMPADGFERSYVKGYYHYVRAWHVRGGNVAARTGRDQMVGFHEHLDKAEEAWQQAWNKKPGDAILAASMLQVFMGQSKSIREKEVWFQRAMEADGDCLLACEYKREYLRPAWGGSTEGLQQFAKHCAATKNHFAGIADYAIKVHQGAAAEFGGGPRAYYSQADVWSELKDYLSDMIKRQPDRNDGRAFLINLAIVNEDFDLAKTHLDAIANNPPYANFGGKAKYDEVRKKVEEHFRKDTPEKDKDPT